jgi:hypothetical protein
VVTKPASALVLPSQSWACSLKRVSWRAPGWESGVRARCFEKTSFALLVVFQHTTHFRDSECACEPYTPMHHSNHPLTSHSHPLSNAYRDGSSETEPERSHLKRRTGQGGPMREGRTTWPSRSCPAPARR